ncbi:MAG: recombinase family protein [Azospirillum sp.]|nr:recombinase family protein [Azospirillum sp.]
MRAVAYYRVSTDKQGRSGLGLEAQREAVRRYLGGDCPPLREFKEVESGKRADRPELRKAVEFAKLHKAALVVAKVDRLARNVAFLETILGSGAEVVFCDLPQVQGAMGRFIIQQMAAVAQLEAGLVSERTKAALAAAKARGVKLGGFRGVKVDPSLGTEARQQAAQAQAQSLAPTIAELRAEGAHSLAALADGLNARRIPAPRGGAWQPMSVSRVLARLEAA